MLFKYPLLTLLLSSLVVAEQNNPLYSLGVSLIQLILGLALAITTTYISIKLFDKMTQEIDEFEELKKGNIAVGISAGALILSIALFLQGNLLSFTYILGYNLGLTERIFGLLVNAISLLFSILIGILSIYIGVRVFDSLTEGIDELKELKKGNVAIGLLLGTVILSYSLLVRNSASTVINKITLHMAVAQQFNSLFFGLVDLFLTMFVSIIMIVIGIKLFYRLTQNIDEVYELKKGNTAVGIVMSVIILSFALLIEPTASSMFDKLAPNLTLLQNVLVILIDLVKLAFTTIISILTIYLAIRIIDTLTKDIDEITELHNDNVSVAIMIAMIVLAVSFVMQTGISNLNNAIAPNTDTIISLLGIQ
ncbi:DUF350 domain-containing protein [Candidatus Micrarchaeota archaeon]|nr:DUF350 domain-containing protein [Candidatus Micrarchaeota archaeon]